MNSKNDKAPEIEVEVEIVEKRSGGTYEFNAPPLKTPLRERLEKLREAHERAPKRRRNGGA